MAALPSDSRQYPQQISLPVDYMLDENLLQALEIAIQSQNSQAILQALDTIKSHHSSLTTSLNDSDFMNQFEAHSN